MTIEEQKKLIAEEKEHAKTNKIISILFITLFLAGPAGIIGYNVISSLKEEYEVKGNKIKEMGSKDSVSLDKVLNIFNQRQK